MARVKYRRSCHSIQTFAVRLHQAFQARKLTRIRCNDGQGPHELIEGVNTQRGQRDNKNNNGRKGCEAILGHKEGDVQMRYCWYRAAIKPACRLC